tara:strand:+ start:452 stop:664 length:213 start_codon:yes stop_codon:yes gene_type:complete
MNNVVKIKEFDPILDRYISSYDKNSIKKTLAFEYFNNDINALDSYIDINLYNVSSHIDIHQPKGQLEFSF